MLGVFLAGCAVAPPAGTELLYGKAQGIGLLVRPDGFTLGIFRDERLYLPWGIDCKFILINSNLDELKQLVALLKEAGTPPSHICSASQPREKQ